MVILTQKKQFNPQVKKQLSFRDFQKQIKDKNKQTNDLVTLFRSDYSPANTKDVNDKFIDLMSFYNINFEHIGKIRDERLKLQTSFTAGDLFYLTAFSVKDHGKQRYRDFSIENLDNALNLYKSVQDICFDRQSYLDVFNASEAISSSYQLLDKVKPLNTKEQFNALRNAFNVIFLGEKSSHEVIKEKVRENKVYAENLLDKLFNEKLDSTRQQVNELALAQRGIYLKDRRYDVFLGKKFNF